jgi:hypothetical protein
LLSVSLGDQFAIFSADRCTNGQHVPGLSHHDRLDDQGCARPTLMKVTLRLIVRNTLSASRTVIAAKASA